MLRAAAAEPPDLQSSAGGRTPSISNVVARACHSKGARGGGGVNPDARGAAAVMGEPDANGWGVRPCQQPTEK